MSGMGIFYKEKTERGLMVKMDTAGNNCKYVSYSPMLSLIEMLNMKGFNKFQIVTKVDGWACNGDFSDLKVLNNTIDIGDKIYTIDFYIKILG